MTSSKALMQYVENNGKTSAVVNCLTKIDSRTAFGLVMALRQQACLRPEVNEKIEKNLNRDKIRGRKISVFVSQQVLLATRINFLTAKNIFNFINNRVVSICLKSFIQ